MKLLYIAGRYRGRTREAVESNISAARFMGRLATERNWMPVIPHLNTADFEHSTDKDDQFWLDGTLTLMQKCDAVLMVPGWKESSGATTEHNLAKRMGIPIFYTFEELPDVNTLT